MCRPSTVPSPIDRLGARRRSVGLPGLKIRKPSRSSYSGMWEWPKTTASASGNRARRRSRRPFAGPASWITPKLRSRARGDLLGQLAAKLRTVDVAVNGGDGSSSRRSASTDGRLKSPAWTIRSAASRASRHGSGRQRSPRGRCVSAIRASLISSDRAPALPLGQLPLEVGGLVGSAPVLVRLVRGHRRSRRLVLLGGPFLLDLAQLLGCRLALWHCGPEVLPLEGGLGAAFRPFASLFRPPARTWRRACAATPRACPGPCRPPVGRARAASRRLSGSGARGAVRERPARRERCRRRSARRSACCSGIPDRWLLNPSLLDGSLRVYEHTFDARRMRPHPPLPADRRVGRDGEILRPAGGAGARAGRGAADRGGHGGGRGVRAAGRDADGRGALALPRAGPGPARRRAGRALLGGGAAAAGGDRRGGRVRAGRRGVLRGGRPGGLWGGIEGVLEAPAGSWAPRAAGAGPGRFCAYAAARELAGRASFPDGAAAEFLAPLPVSLLCGRLGRDDEARRPAQRARAARDLDARPARWAAARCGRRPLRAAGAAGAAAGARRGRPAAAATGPGGDRGRAGAARGGLRPAARAGAGAADLAAARARRAAGQDAAGAAALGPARRRRRLAARGGAAASQRRSGPARRCAPPPPRPAARPGRDAAARGAWRWDRRPASS